jgi:uncharacterized membrane protein YfcA
MHFPVSGVDVAWWVPPLVAFGVSLVTSTGGVSGAFLLLPFQMSVLGFTSPAVSATNQLFNVVAIPSGVVRYVREGRMVWPLAWVVVAGTLPGVLVGAVVRVRLLPDPTAFKAFAGLVLAWIGARLVADLVRRPTSGAARAEARFRERVHGPGGVSGGLPPLRVAACSIRKVTYEFGGETFTFSTATVFLLSLAVGVVGGVYGIGGGAIVAPFFVAVLGLPIHTVAGAALLGTFVTSVAGVLFYQAIAPFHPGMAVAPDWALGLLFGIGGAAGMYCGARLQKRFPARAIKWMLVAVILFVAGKYLLGIVELL